VCNPGWLEPDCKTVDLCYNNTCSSNGTCKDQKCVCNPGWLEPDCKSADFCYNNTCSSNGTCKDQKCVCNPGWAPPKCLNKVFTWDSEQTMVTDSGMIISSNLYEPYVYNKYFSSFSYNYLIGMAYINSVPNTGDFMLSFTYGTSGSVNISDYGKDFKWTTPINLAVTHKQSFPSVGIVGGKISIAFKDSDGGLSYIRSTDWSGTKWGSVQRIQNTLVENYISLNVDLYYPSICYYDTKKVGWLNVMFVRALDRDGMTWSTPVSLLTFSKTGLEDFPRYLSLHSVNRRPYIIFNDHTKRLSGQLASDNYGDTWAWTDREGITGISSTPMLQYPSTLIVDGQPALCYFDDVTRSLNFTRKTSNGWSTPKMIAKNVFIAGNTSLQIIRGKPLVCWHNYTTKTFMFVRALDISGSEWDIPQSIASTINDGFNLTSSLLEYNYFTKNSKGEFKSEQISIISCFDNKTGEGKIITGRGDFVS
jgi:hypothetical protein